MKTQLLQDIDESHSYPGSAPTPARPAPAAEPVPPSAAAPAPPVQRPPEPKPAAKDAAHVWRRPEPEPVPEQVYTPPPPPPPLPPQRPHAATPRPTLAQPDFIPDPGSSKETHWVDRWGRQAGTLTACAIGAVLLAGIGYWYHRESKIDDTMAIVATSSASVRSTVPAQAAPAAVVPSAPVATEAPLPPMVLLEQPAAAPAPLPAPAAAKAEPDPVEPEPVADKPEPVLAKTEPVAEQAEPAAVKPKRQPVKKPAPVIAKAEPAEEPERPARPRPKPALPPAPKMTPAQVAAETLRQCRAAGYHAERCIERGCVLTKYGLACRG